MSTDNHAKTTNGSYANSLQEPSIIVCALYKFVSLANYFETREALLELMHEMQVKGTILLADEGINGTIAGSRAGIDRVLAWLAKDERLSGMEYKESFARQVPFKRAKVKLKKEIVTMGVNNIDPRSCAGTYVHPAEWNVLLQDPEVLVIDTRNEYEIEVGTFAGAINPHTQNFREFPEYANRHLDSRCHKKIAMFCTGGIRCEKSTALLKQQGFCEVYHLKGGILNYLEKIPESDSLWQGECFVFDERVTVNHQLKKGQYDQCNACRMPITEEDKANEKYMAGVSCPKCFRRSTDKQKQRFLEREKQIQLARMRGEQHIGDGVAETIAKRRQAKLLNR